MESEGDGIGSICAPGLAVRGVGREAAAGKEYESAAGVSGSARSARLREGGVQDERYEHEDDVSRHYQIQIRLDDDICGDGRRVDRVNGIQRGAIREEKHREDAGEGRGGVEGGSVGREAADIGVADGIRGREETTDL